AGQAQPRYPQFHRVFEQRQVPDPANGLVVDGRYRLVTARTKALCALYGRQFQRRPGLAAPILLTPIPYAITLPATQLEHTIHFGHGRPRFVASRTTILPGRPCASLPSVGRRTSFLPPPPHACPPAWPPASIRQRMRYKAGK